MRRFWTAILEVEEGSITCHPTAATATATAATTASCSAKPLGLPDSLTLHNAGWNIAVWVSRALRVAWVDLGIPWAVAEQLAPVLQENRSQLFCYTPWYSKIHPCYTRARESQTETLQPIEVVPW